MVTVHLCEVEQTQFSEYKCMDQNLDSCALETQVMVQFLLHDHFNQTVTTASNTLSVLNLLQ